MMLRLIVCLGLTVSVSAAEPGEPLVKSPYPANLDRAATGKWWEVARKAREGQVSGVRHTTNKNIVTGRHFLDLEAPRDEVVWLLSVSDFQSLTGGCSRKSANDWLGAEAKRWTVRSWRS